MGDFAASHILDGALASPTARGFVEDILEAFGGAEVEYLRAQALGSEWHASGGQDVAALWRELARLGRAVEEALAERCSDEADSRRLRVAIDEATAHALAAFGEARRARRDRWLSFLSHEMRNALNTLVNANWIIRNAEGRPPAKICDMTDRAVRKLEGLVKELRDLENQVVKPAPGRQEKV
jgi:signal transduction histidine kinase